jgi:predicted nucleotidyltransferase
VTSAATRSGTLPARSLNDVHEPAVRAWIEEALRRPETLGFLLCGSRVTGWAEPDGDYDGFLYVTEAHYRSLDVEQTDVRLTADGEAPKRLIADFSLFSDAALEEQLRSPLDIDHWPYVDAVVLHDTGGALETWRRRIAAFPEEGHRERALHKYIQLAIAFHYATMDDVRGYPVDRQMNLYRAALAGVHLWFTLQRRWAPPLKWWTREVERLEIRPDTQAVMEGSILNPTIETLTHLRDHLKTEMKHAGISEVDDVLRAFFTTLLPEHRPAVYRNSYL